MSRAAVLSEWRTMSTGSTRRLQMCLQVITTTLLSTKTSPYAVSMQYLQVLHNRLICLFYLAVHRTEFGYYGRNCEQRNACISRPCFNDGLCVNETSNTYRCECQSGYYGGQCQFLNGCDDGPCGERGICTNTTVTGGYSCECFGG